jgi:hypothetical protein
MEKQELVSKDQELPVQQQTAADGMIALIERVVRDPSADLDKLDRLLQMRKEYDKQEAEKAFHEALAGFKSESIQILKDKHVKIPHKDRSGATEYDHATLGNIIQTVAPFLSRHGLSHTWEVQTGEQVTVKCVISHRLGHSQSVSMTGPYDDSGRKNRLQQMASTTSYLERYTFLAATGLAAVDQDDDGRKAGTQVEHVATEIQKAKVRNLIESSEALELYCYVQEIGQAAYEGIVDEFPEGSKTRLKAAARTLEEQGFQELDDILEAVTQAISGGEKFALEENLDLGFVARLLIWKKLSAAQQTAAREILK